jgi:FlaA1/EpsC-like NDP-sugar epimerase
MWSAARGVSLGVLATFVVFTLFELHPARVPTGVCFIDLLLCLALVAGSRLLAPDAARAPLPGQVVARGKEALIVGAGDAAQLVIKEMLRNSGLGYTPIGIVDDDPRKRNMRLHGSACSARSRIARTDPRPSPDEVLIAIPSASGELRGRIVETARAAVPGEDAAEPRRARQRRPRPRAQLRPVEVEDVLGREPVEVDLDAIAGYVAARSCW